MGVIGGKLAYIGKALPQVAGLFLMNTLCLCVRQDPQRPGLCHGLHPLPDTEFAVDVADVYFDRTHGNRQSLGNLLVRKSLGNELNHFQFTLSERLNTM